MLDEASPVLARKAAAVCATLFFVAPASYWSLERYVATRFRPWYSYKRQATTDLGNPYAYHDPDADHNRPIVSLRSDVMNFNFVSQGLLYLAGHIYLAKATADTIGDKFTKAKVTIAALYCIGLSLVAFMPRSLGKRNSGDRPARWLHSLGSLLGILGPHVNCILVGLSTPADLQPIYRKLSLLLGTAGMLGIPAFVSRKRNSSARGFWQRWMLYVNPVWEASTAIAITSALLRHPASVRGTKRL